jgi:hypothetical protein
MHFQYAYVKRKMLFYHIDANSVAHEIINSCFAVSEFITIWKLPQWLLLSVLHKILYINNSLIAYKENSNITSFIYSKFQTTFILQKYCLKMPSIGIDNFLFDSILTLFSLVNLIFFLQLMFLQVFCLR